MKQVVDTVAVTFVHDDTLTRSSLNSERQSPFLSVAACVIGRQSILLLSCPYLSFCQAFSASATSALKVSISLGDISARLCFLAGSL